MTLNEIDDQILDCNKCENNVEKFDTCRTVSVGTYNSIVIVGESPANNGWRKSGKAWYSENGKLIPSGVILQNLLSIVDLKLEDIYFLEAIKCYIKNRKYIDTCSGNCRQFLLNQLEIINPEIVLSLGDTATKAILDIKYSKFRDVVGKSFNINGYKVIPIYHPSPASPMSYKGNIPIFEDIKEKGIILKRTK